MDVRWDPKKEAANLKKHGIEFSDAELVLADPYAITRQDPHIQEERFVSTGLDALGRLLTVVYTYRKDHIRLISARPATESERKSYEK